MLCKNYDSLSHFEKIVFIGELMHSCQCDDDIFEKGKKLIQEARDKGVLNGVVILPDNNLEDTNQLTMFAQ